MRIVGKVLVLLGFLSGQLALAPTGEYDVWGDKLVKLIVSLDLVARRYYGCPEEGVFDSRECRKAYGRVDYKMLEKSREQAIDFYKIKERE